MRTLRSKHKRNLLWLASGGKCANCGASLGFEFHADHIVPYSITSDTNVHDMQALCGPCNLQKGTKMLRQHQLEMDRTCRRIIAGEMPELRKIIAQVTPGGGKSLLPVILASRLIPTGIVNKICWVAPRQSLQEQAEEVFCSDFSRKILGHKLKIRQSTNEIDPSRGLAGYVTTYQALQADQAGINLDEFKRNKYCLILDEPHHVEDGGVWMRPLERLAERAALLVLMTGTLERGNGKPVAFIDYVPGSGGRAPNLDDSPYQRVIKYSRSQALQEQAIIPLHFEHFDGQARWLDSSGREVSINSLARAEGDANKALEAAVESQYAEEVINKCIQHWRRYRQHRADSKVLVVAPWIRIAKHYHKYLTKTLSVAAEIATADDSVAARDAIRRYKTGAISCLITVGMAYEGLDVPSITHLVGLTRFRSKPWIEQMLARCNRHDPKGGPWEQQYGYIYVPDDEAIHECISDLIAEQAPFIRDRTASGGAGGGGGTPDEIIPLSSSVTQQRARAFAAGELVDYDRTSDLNRAAVQHGIIGSTIQLDGFVKALTCQPGASLEPPTTHPEIIPSREEKTIGDKIEAHARAWDRANRLPFGTLNGKIYDKFKKRRPDMSLEQLIEVWAWVQNVYPRI